MPDRQFFTMKFNSFKLKKNNYRINKTFAEAKYSREIIALADSEMLRQIRKITGKTVDKEYLEYLYQTRDNLKLCKNSSENIKKIKIIQDKINEILFIPEYITITIEHMTHYNYLFRNGLYLNNKKYIRFSCSASQGRSSTVVFCEESIAKKLDTILDNGRNKKKHLTPSKFNAYKGLSSSATKTVTSPRFCIVPDYNTKKEILVNFVEEVKGNKDDKIIQKTIIQGFNRFDGQGLISPNMAKIWSNDLELDYIPAQWCIRQNYIKGMLCTFDFHDFCETVNNGNYEITTIYGNKVDLRQIDIILSESQFKLWDSFSSQEEYDNNCIVNDLRWGVSLYSPEYSDIKNILKMNYQFIQTLNLSENDVQILCSQFIDWINGVNGDNVYYTLLFLIGKNPTKGAIKKYLNSSDNYWIRGLIYNHELIKDKYIKNKIFNLIKRRIERGCLGEIIVDGNFQTIVSDPYAMMQYVCGQNVTGLLKEGQYYSNYWNNRNVSIVDSMRSPMTYLSEHLKLNLVKNKETEYWYKYSYAGIITNVFDSAVLNWAGADFDYDQVATTSNNIVLNGVYEDELPVVYEPPKATKEIITSENLFHADLFSFGSIIGSITNKSTSGYALLPLFKKNSKQYNTTIKRLKMCTKLQSAQIDKAKIGTTVKGIPEIWTKRNKINKNDSPKTAKQKELHNSMLLDRHPYFFTYLYSDTNNKFRNYYKKHDTLSSKLFKVSLNELIQKDNKNMKELEFLESYNRYLPVIYSDCVMNNLCRYIESVSFKIKAKINIEEDKEIFKFYKNYSIQDNQKTKEDLLFVFKNFINGNKDYKNSNFSNAKNGKNKYNGELDRELNFYYEDFKSSMENICSNIGELVNYLVDFFYMDNMSLNKDLLWNTYGDVILLNIKNNNKNIILFPFPDDNGDIEYLNRKYTLEEL